MVAVLYNWLVNSPLSRQSGFEKDVDIKQGDEIPRILAEINITRETVTQWRNQMLLMEEKRKEERELVFMSQGSARVLSSLYRTLLFLFNNITSYRLVRQREFRYGNANCCVVTRCVDSSRAKQPVFTLGIWCLNPSIIFRDLASKAKSIILTSGTLSPMDTFSSELGVHFEHRLEALHVIDPGQVWVGAIGVGPTGCELKGTFKELETFSFQDDIATALIDIAGRVPDGVLCFLPSYSFLDKLLKRMESTGSLDKLKAIKRVFLEPRQGSLKEFEQLMRSYYKTISLCVKKKSGPEGSMNFEEESDGEGISVSKKVTGAIFFAVFRGKVSEGLDFADENARAVVSVGIPFPALKDERVIQKRLYNDLFSKERGLLNGNLWYDKQAFRALNQALGRCIRHRYDWGAVILLEKRFFSPTNINGLSKWIRPQVQGFFSYQEGTDSLSAFISHHHNKT